MNRLSFILFFLYKTMWWPQWSLGHLHGNSGVGIYKMVSEFLTGRLGGHSVFPEVGVRQLQVLEMASKAALVKLPKVAVQALTEVQQSSILAIVRSFLGTGTETMPLSFSVIDCGNTNALLLLFYFFVHGRSFKVIQKRFT